MIQILLTVNKQRFKSYWVKICYVIHLISIDACKTYMSLCIEIRRKMYSSKASSKFSGGCRLLSTIYIIHRSNMSVSHGRWLRNIHSFWQISMWFWSTSFTWLVAWNKRGSVYRTTGRPLGEFWFFVGLIRWQFQTFIIPSMWSCKKREFY